MTKSEREYIGNDEVAYWQVVNRKGGVEATFQHRADADNIVIGSGCLYLYTVRPVFSADLLSRPRLLQTCSFD